MSMMTTDDFPLQVEVEAGMPAHAEPVFVAFGFYPKLNEEKTLLAGHEVYEEVEFVKIKIPGDRTFEYFQPVLDGPKGHRNRFPKAYAAFKARTAGHAAVTGLPIEQVPGISRSLAMTFKSAGIHTAEELAAVGDHNVDKIGGINGREWRDRVRTFLTNAKDNAESIRVARERDDLLKQLAAMQAQIDGLKANGAIGNVQSSGNAVIADDVEQDVVAAARRPRAGNKAA